MLGKRKPKHGDGLTVAVEICRTQLHLAVSQVRPDRPALIRTQSVSWREEAGSIHSETGRLELVKALKSLAAKYKFQGRRVRFALSGDDCVTRVVTGTSESVRRELSRLEHRSALYLSLGHGQKAVGGAHGQIDARHQHALLSVVNEKTLSALTDVAARCGLELELIEPSMVGICRVLGQAEIDSGSPVLVVNINERGVEVGISHRGRLLLDYRPAGKHVRQSVAGIVQEHLGRLQRYCTRYYRFADGKLEHVYLCGDPAEVAKAHRDFESGGKLPAEVLEVKKLLPEIRIETETADTRLIAAVGATRIEGGVQPHMPTPNLLSRLHEQTAESIWPAVLKHFWPALAAVLAGMLLWWVPSRAAHHAGLLEMQIAKHRQERLESQTLFRTVLQQRKAVEQIRHAHAKIISPRWDELLTVVAKCLPEDVWLDGFSIDGGGRVEVRGTSYSEKGVYELLAWLKRSGRFHRVALTGTQPSRTRRGPATGFEVHAQLAGSADSEDQPTHES